MVHLLYPRFLEQDEEYEAAERFWQTMFQELANQAGSSPEWRPWRPRAYANGLPFERDGNPIFDALNQRSGRAVQVIQWPPERNEAEISAWISQLDVDLAGEDRVISELTINLSLSVESAAVARRLLASWLDETTSVNEIEHLIGELTEIEPSED